MEHDPNQAVPAGIGRPPGAGDGAVCGPMPSRGIGMMSLLQPQETETMLQSHVIEIDGTFVGAALRTDQGYRFIATDLRVEELDGSLRPTLQELRILAGQLYRTGRFGARRAETAQ